MKEIATDRKTLLAGRPKIRKVAAIMIAITALVFVVIPVTAQDAPLARMTLPIRGQTLRGSVAIQGSASAPQFTRYQVMYAPEPDINNWIVINGAVQPVPNGTLAVWNTRPIADGKYAVKLQVFSSDGSAVEAVVRDISLANQSATPANSPPAAAISTGLQAVITNTLAISNTTGLPIQGTSSSQTLNLADLPRAFARGATYTAYAFGVLVAYLILKKLVGFLIKRIFRKPINCGR